MEKQTLVEVNQNHRKETEPKTPQRKLEESTQEILDKIAEVNRKHGLAQKRTKPTYFHFPLSYSRSNEEEKNQRQGSSFKWPTNPYTNPIFEYLEDEEKRDSSSLRNAPQTQQIPVYSFTNPNAAVTKDDIIPGQYIKRKITHQQTVLVPMNQMYPGYQTMASPYYPSPLPETRYPSLNALVNNSMDQNHIQNLEDQTIDTIKNIVTNSQFVNTQYMNALNKQQTPSYAPYSYYQNNPYYGLYGPYVVPSLGSTDAQSSRPAARQWNWPGSQYFPIVIRDPVLQMLNAITTMIEYGPGGPGGGGGGGGGGCKNPKITEEVKRSPKTVESPENMNKLKDPLKLTFMDIEDLNIANDEDIPIQFLVKLKASKKSKHTETETKAPRTVKSKEPTKVNGTRQEIGSKLEKIETLQRIDGKLFFKQTPPSPPVREPEPLIEELYKEEEEPEDERAEDITITNDGTRKTFTKENTGSGIFIHRLKVRKGGVAIAGPGGIATAGSGGTAIVGPNGVAYTHPDSLAIAGSGTKVVAVDPMINLSDIVNNSTLLNNRNKTSKFDIPSARVGKVVAVGPVVYYNKG